MSYKSRQNAVISWGWWVSLLLVAALLRIPHADWDDGIAAHPDERYIISVMQDTPLYANPAAISEGFAYGHLPVTIARLFFLCAPSADPLFVLRILSALVGVLIVAVGIKLALQVGARYTAVLTGVILAFSPLLLQHARYYTVDSWATLLGAMALLAVLKRRWWGAGLYVGLALSCKVSMVWGALPLLISVYLMQAMKTARGLKDLLRNRVVWCKFVPAVLLAYALTSPWMLLQPRISWLGPYTQSLIVSGQYPVPFTTQYVGTLPWLYPLWQMGLWGMGMLPAVLGMVGMICVLLCWRNTASKLKVMALYALVYFAGVGGLFVKFPRYLLPLYPVWALLAALALTHLCCQWLRQLITVVVVAMQVGLGLAQVNVYRQTHPWMTASEWLYDNVPASVVLSIEEWDHPLPVNMACKVPHQQVTLPVFAAESTDKLQTLMQINDTVDVIVLASRRGYGALCREDCDSPTMAWYAQVLSEREVEIFMRCAQLFGIALTDDPLRDAGLSSPQSLADRCGTRYAIHLPQLDESFRVYDAPLVLILYQKWHINGTSPQPQGRLPSPGICGD